MMMIGSMYLPPGRKVKLWDNIDTDIINAKATRVDRIVLLGGLNCNMLEKGSKLEESLESLHITIVIKEATHITPTRKCTDII